MATTVPLSEYNHKEHNPQWTQHDDGANTRRRSERRHEQGGERWWHELSREGEGSKLVAVVDATDGQVMVARARWRWKGEGKGVVCRKRDFESEGCGYRLQNEGEEFRSREIFG
ncbi:hypothetical protein V6N13_108139 [Hibiscus sabdariffa]